MDINDSGSPGGLYLHIPFCRNKCDYCSFYSVSSMPGSPEIDLYITRLIQELEEYKKSFGPVVFDTLYIGGGTPSMLSVAQMDRIIEAAGSLFAIMGGAEVTIEMNPDDLLSEKLYGFRDAGVTRIVLGIQSTILDIRKTLGRRGINCTEKNLEMFFSVPGIVKCLDFIGGIPGQSETHIDKDFTVIERFRPEHISFYMLSVEEGTPLSARIRPDSEFEEHQRRIWEHAIGRLKDMGYRHYEISNFALNGFESRHNMKYWNFRPYLGAGPGAHSFFNGSRFSNPPSLRDYMKPGVFNRVTDCRGADQLLVEFIMTSLRRLEGFTADEYRRVSGCPMPREVIKRMEDKVSEKLMNYENGRYCLTAKGIFLADRIIYDLAEPFL